MIPKNPLLVFINIDVIIEVESFNAVGENNENTPILQIKNIKMYGTNLKSTDGTLVKYLKSNFGPHA